MTEVQFQSNRIATFGAALKRWRAHRKFSQLQLALESQVSQRHVSFLESGRAMPSREMVIQLAQALEVPLRERNSLLQAAGFAPVYRQRTFDDEQMKPIREALAMMLKHHQPYPAVVLDRDYNLLMENPPFQALLKTIAEPQELWRRCSAPGVKNLLALTFHPDGARPFIENIEEIARIMAPRLRREMSAPDVDDALRTLVVDLMSDFSAEEDTAHDISASPPPVVPLALNVRGVRLKLFSMISTFGTPHDITTDELRVEHFFPANDETEKLLRAGAAPVH
ncbi:MAG: helix-turn-helix transcriptional regulator [Pseudomonadota bacterium]